MIRLRVYCLLLEAGVQYGSEESEDESLMIEKKRKQQNRSSVDVEKSVGVCE